MFSSTALPLDKELLAAARVQFSRPPTAVNVPKFIEFQQGETINPYRNEKPAGDEHPLSQNSATNTQLQQQQLQQQQTPTCSSESQFELDPLRPPIVRLTQQSTEGDGRFLKARLRDPKIMRIVRLFLAYMKDQPDTVCVDGMTPTSIRMHLASEGLPLDPERLLSIFKDVHEEYGVDAAAAMADLQSYQRFLSSERTHRLQQLRESTNKFHSLSSAAHFRK